MAVPILTITLTLALVATIYVPQASSTFSHIVEDSCAYGACPTNKVTKEKSPLTVAYLYGTDVAGKGWNECDKPYFEAWAAKRNVTIVIKRPEAEALRFFLTNLMGSSMGPDIMTCQSTRLIKSEAYDLTPRALANNWHNRYWPRQLDQVTEGTGADKKILGQPEFSNFWGIWYFKSRFAELGVNKPPTTWRELFDVAQRIRSSTPPNQQAGQVPLGYGAQTEWQPATLWSIIALRLGGATRWNKLIIDGSTDFSKDPIVAATLTVIQEMTNAGFFDTIPRKNATASITDGETITNFLGSGRKTAMVYWPGSMYSTAKLYATALQINVSDIEFFPVPKFYGDERDGIPLLTALHTLLADAHGNSTQSGLTLPLEVKEEADLGTSVSWVMNRNAKNPDMALEFLDMLASDDYALTAGLCRQAADGRVPALKIAYYQNSSSQIMDDLVLRGISYVNNNVSNLVDTTDVAAPWWTKVVKPWIVKFFHQEISIKDISQKMEDARITEMLKQSLAPVYSLESGEYRSLQYLTLDAANGNGTIYYALASITSATMDKVTEVLAAATYIQYSGRIVLLPRTDGYYIVQAYAVGKGMVRSENIQKTYSIKLLTELKIGDIVPIGYRYNANAFNFVGSLLIVVVAFWLFEVLLDWVHRFKSKVDRGLAKGNSACTSNWILVPFVSAGFATWFAFLALTSIIGVTDVDITVISTADIEVTTVVLVLLGYLGSAIVAGILFRRHVLNINPNNTSMSKIYAETSAHSAHSV